MARTHRKSPQEIAAEVIVSNMGLDREHADDRDYDVETNAGEIHSLIMLGIAAYNDPSNQREENLSEACARLGVNLLWVPTLTAQQAEIIGPVGSIQFDHATDREIVDALEEIAALDARIGTSILSGVIVGAGY